MNPRPFRVARRGGHRDVPASPSPPFTVGAKDTTREADLVRSPALRWLRREIGPKGTLPRVSEPEGSDSYLTPGRSWMIPVSRRRSPLPRAFSRRDPELAVAPTRGSPSEDALGSWSSFAGSLQAHSRCFLHSTTSMGTPFDRTSPKASCRTLSRANREASPRTFRHRRTRTAFADPSSIPERGAPEIASYRAG